MKEKDIYNRKQFEREFGNVFCTACKVKIKPIWDDNGHFVLKCNHTFFDIEKFKEQIEGNDFQVLKHVSPFWIWRIEYERK